MNYVRRFLCFWVDFVVGDDWRVSAGVVLALAATVVAAKAAPAWWLMPGAAIGLLAMSVLRGARPARTAPPAQGKAVMP